MEIGMRIKAKRKALGLTCEKLGRKIGCSAAYISLLERGGLPKGNPKKFAALKRALRVRGGAKPVIRKPRGVPKRVSDSYPAQVMTLLKVLVDEVRELSTLVKGLPTGTTLRPLVRPMPPKPPAADGVATLTATQEKGGLDQDRRYPWKGMAKEVAA